MRAFLLGLLARQAQGGPVDGALAAYAAAGYLPFSYLAPQGSDWRSGGQRGKLGQQPVTASA
jgi:hypothetical protein